MAKRTMRWCGVALEVAIGIFLVALLVSALRTPETKASPAKAKDASKSLLPFQGTSCVITCPASITVVAAATCPFAASSVVTYPAPTTSGTCGTVTCTPPSGSSFPIGSTTVTCSDTGGASCGFTVSVFGMCLQDDSNPGNVVLFNPSTGAYQFCCNGVVAASGTGTASVKGCVVTILHNPANYRVRIIADTSVKKGNATIQLPPGVVKCTIGDRDMTNNTCACPVAAPPPPV